MSMNAVIGDVTLMTGLVGGANYSMNQASYDLARSSIPGPRPAAAPLALRRRAASSTVDTKSVAHH